MYYIYIIQNTVNDKVYVGQTRRKVSQRYQEHKRKLNNGTHHNKLLQNSWNKYSEVSFSYYTLIEIETQEEVNQAEEFYISWYRKLNLCYNVSDGGELHLSSIPWNKGKEIPSHVMEALQEGRKKYFEEYGHPLQGKTHSEETKEKMRQAKLGKPSAKKGIPVSEEQKEKQKQALKEYYKTHEGPNKGKVFSEEFKEKISNSKKGIKQSPELIKKRVDSRKGYTPSEETKKKMSDANKKWRQEKLENT